MTKGNDGRRSKGASERETRRTANETDEGGTRTEKRE